MDFDDELLPLLDDDEDKYEERLMRPMLQPSTLAIVSVGQDFLRKAEADNISWGALNHHALQPSSLMSCRAAQKVWEASCHDITPLEVRPYKYQGTYVRLHRPLPRIG